MERLPYSWHSKRDVVEMATLPKVTYKFNEISIEISTFFLQGNKKNPKIRMDSQKTLNTQRHLEEKGLCWKYYNIYFKLYYRTIVIKRK
jgi:hypothetical protein